MSEVFCLQCAFDFEWEVIIHPKHHAEHILIFYLLSPLVTDRSEQNWPCATQVVRVSVSEVWIDNHGSEAEAGDCPRPLLEDQSFVLGHVRVV